MKKGNLTRQQAVGIVGEQAVAMVDNENCDFTNRMQCDGDTSVEFSASINTKDGNGDLVNLVAYYYQEQSDIDSVESLDQLDWEVEGYEII